MISYFSFELLNLNNSDLLLPKSIWNFCRLLKYQNPPKRVAGLENLLNSITADSRIL